MFHPVHSAWDGRTLLQTPDPKTHTPLSPETQWQLWKADIANVQNLNGYKNPQLPNFELLFEFCEFPSAGGPDTPNQPDRSALVRSQFLGQDSAGSTGFENYDTGSDENPPLGTMTSDAGVNGSSSIFMDGIKKENSWLAYKNNFELMEDTNAEYIPTIDEVPLSSLAAGATQVVSTRKDKDGFVINGNTIPPLGSGVYDDEVIAVKGKPVYKIRMTGYAIRVGWQIPTPVLVGATPDGSTVLGAYRVGKQKWTHDILSVSEEVPVFIAKWSQMYALPFDPSGTNIKFGTSGEPAEFA
jgi:hypothetical protein